MDNNLPTGLPPDTVIFGKSALMLDLKAKLRRILGTNLPILLQGESGTGKRVLSKYIHKHSENIVGSYLSVDCASNSDTLLECLRSTLVETDDKPNGGVLSAQREISVLGTLFLDEVGELSPKSQLHLLKSFLEFQDSGGDTQPYSWARARIIGATARKLRQEVKERRFRGDLFYRLAVVTLEVPPLRDRLDDLLVIANYLRLHYSKNFGLPERPFSNQLVERMHCHGWPGNIRELENFVCRYVILGPEERLLRELSGSSENAVAPGLIAPGETLMREVTRRTTASVEREMIVKALALHQGSIRRAAQALGVSYRTLMNKMDKASLPRVRHTKRSGENLKS